MARSIKNAWQKWQRTLKTEFQMFKKFLKVTVNNKFSERKKNMSKQWYFDRLIYRFISSSAADVRF